MVEDATPEQKYLFAIDCLCLLASPFDVQKAVLRADPLAEEVAAVFADLQSLLGDIDVTRKFLYSTLSRVFLIARIIDEVHGDVRLWSERALQGDRRWDAVRELAKGALTAQGEPYREPLYQGAAR